MDQDIDKVGVSSALPPSDRYAELRQQLKASRLAWLSSPAAAQAPDKLARVLEEVLSQLEPQCLGVYSPMSGEFNPLLLTPWMKRGAGAAIALPWAQRSGQMHYRRWDLQPPRAVDEYGIASSDGAKVEPDVVLVPCVGWTPSGGRLGYGGGFFDRWLADRPHVISVGLGWSLGRLSPEQWQAASHDVPLTCILSEQGVEGP